MKQEDVHAHMTIGVSVTEEVAGSLLNGGRVDIRKTHRNLWLLASMDAMVCVLLALNFLVLPAASLDGFATPTFPLWHAPNELWGVCFAVLGIGKLLALNVWRSLGAVRLLMTVEVVYLWLVTLGACEPWLDGQGSLQLPIVYLYMTAVQIPLILEPFINPLTVKR